MTPASTQRLANAIRALAMDAVERANSGHPGMPMGMAEIALALWKGPLRHNPADPNWLNRDRVVLSNGHGSMLLYAVLHLTGYDLPMVELCNFRQLHSRTPGHPEYRVTPGVETTTGPLGQGFANAVGMALAERLLAERFNRPNFPIVDHRTYVLVGDGCMMEGISHEAASFAGTLGLSKLVAIYDDNGISIDGPVRDWFTDDTAQRFAAYGWDVIDAVDGHDLAALRAVLERTTRARRPTLICCKTVIGKGAPIAAGTEQAHGQALGEAQVAATRLALDWPYAPFEIPDDVYMGWDCLATGAALQAAWQELAARYARQYPDQWVELQRRVGGTLPPTWRAAVDRYTQQTLASRQSLATRKASQNALAAYAVELPELLGGSADLTASNLTQWPGAGAVRAGPPFVPGRHINFGVREFGMNAICNGLALHGGFIPFCGTFLTFSDYGRSAIRMAALMGIRSIFVFTHDSIGLGEDGPTHQPVEHAASLRLIPNLDVWRPADTTEAAVAWAAAIERKDGPSALLFSRQSTPFLVKDARQANAIRHGAYVLYDDPHARVALIATGSEVALALGARDALNAQGIGVRVVSMPSTTVFDRQHIAYKAAVLPDGVPRVAIEAGVTDFWWKYVRSTGAVVGLDTFGASAPAAALFQHFHLTVDNVVATAKAVL